MHFAALVALVVITSSVPGLAAPAPNPHPQAISKRDDSSTVHGSNLHVALYERSLGRVPDSVTTKRDDGAYVYPYERSPGPVLDSVTQRDGDSSKRSQTLPAGDDINWIWTPVYTSSNSTKRQAYSIIPQNGYLYERSLGPVLDSVTTQRDGDSQKLYPSKRFLTLPDTSEGYTWESEGTSSNSTKRQAYSIIDSGVDYNVKRPAESIVIPKEDGATEGTAKRQAESDGNIVTYI
ncbi:hypothetical protein BDR05DRAFT_991557 [Suillus weaverae]|nr:hypothetical protein BDR05DRAFT_991557 [Suillus weaverae]